MTIQWNELKEIFNTDNGSLPNIKLKNLSSQEIVDGYAILRDCSEKISSKDPYYWLKIEEKEIKINFNSNPSEQVVSGRAEAFHLCFDGIKSQTGKKVPKLGVFVFTDSLVLDYRMGKEWSTEAIEGLFEIIKTIESISKDMVLEHTSNINDIDGNILTSKWRKYSNTCMKDETEPKGMGGWLILIAIGVTISPFLAAIMDFGAYYTSFDIETWNALTNNNSIEYNPYYASFFSIELVTSVVIDMYLFYLMYLFYKKSSYFPSLYIKLVFAVLIFIVLDIVMASLVFPNLTTNNLFDPLTIRGLSQSIFVILVWVPYMKKSVRVKNTFVN